jgi:hypothetical protein
LRRYGVEAAVTLGVRRHTHEYDRRQLSVRIARGWSSGLRWDDAGGMLGREASCYLERLGFDGVGAAVFVTKSWADRWAQTLMSVGEDRNFAAYEALFHRDVVWCSPAFECVGAAEVRRRYQDILAAIPDYQSQVRTWAVDVVADRATFEAVQTGTIARDLVGTATTFPASPTQVSLQSVMTVEFDSAGLVTEVRMYFDPAQAGGLDSDRVPA